MSDLIYTNIQAEWADELKHLEHSSFPTTDRSNLYDTEQLRALARDFPEGGIAVLDGDTLVAMGLGIRIHFDFDCTQNYSGDIFGTARNLGHIDDGPWYHGTCIAVLPTYRRRGIGGRLYDMRKQICRDLNLAGIVGGGVIPGYTDHKHEMSAADYTTRVAAGELYDPTLTMQIANGFEVRGVIVGYLNDPMVDNWTSLIVWENPDYSADI